MPPDEYEDWLGAQGGTGQATLSQTGAKLFRQFGCSGCHGANSSVHAPSLAGIYNHPVPLEDGTFVTADEQYLRDSILKPDSQIVAGYKPIMPSYQGQMSEQDVIALVSYIKALGEPPPIAETRDNPPIPTGP